MLPDFSDLIKEASSHSPSPVWCNWEGKAHSWAGPLPSIQSVASGQHYANVTQIPFRDPDHFIAANLQNHLPAWESILVGHPKADELFGYLSLGVDVRDFLVHFKGYFQGRYFDSALPPRNIFPNARNCANHEDFISTCILDRVKNGSLLVHGKVGSVDPPYLVMPITVEPSKPRMCHDERFLNLWIKDSPFTLDYITNLPRYVGLDHFQTTLDDKSGYDHVPLHPQSRTFFGLEWKGYYFMYKTLPFGWKASAYIYHTIGMAATCHIRSLGVPSSNYIDDKHLGQLRPLNQPRFEFSNLQLSEMALFIACSILLNLGYFLGIKKSCLIPSIKVKYLGYFSESDKQAFTLPSDKVLKFAALRDCILDQKTVSLKTLQKFAGKTTSFSLLVPGAKLYTNAVYNAISKGSRSGKPIPVSGALRDELVHWRFLDSWDGFLPWKEEKHSSITLFSDASDVGWGGSVRIPGREEQLLRGYWDDSTRNLPIAVREAKALLFTLESLGTSVANTRLDCFIDNKAVVSSWRKQASKAPALSHVMKSIFQLTLRFNLALSISFVPSADNPADRPSRTLSDIDCKLSSLAWKSVQLAYGPHSLDLLALASNVQRDLHDRPLRFYAPFPNPGCSGVNVFAQSISHSENAYAFPPFILLGPLLKFLSPQPCPLTIIAPDLRPRQYWWPILQHKASSCFKIGSKGQNDILLFPDASQHGAFSPRPLQWDLWAFRLSVN